PKEQTTEAVKEALKEGYVHVSPSPLFANNSILMKWQIDSATGYYNQAEAAEAIRQSGVPREQVFFTTKVFTFGQSPGYHNTVNSLEAALEQTKLDYLDLVLIHAPYGGSEGRKGSWKALVEYVEKGKVRSIGVSNYGVQHLEELEKHIKELEEERGGKGKGGVISVGQWEVHPWLTRPDIVQWCRERGIVVEAYCPIVRGQRSDEPKVKELAEKYGKTPAQILLRWSLQKELVP
ncbi:unnamed protein product, partial [Fusarium langsethiae]